MVRRLLSMVGVLLLSTSSLTGQSVSDGIVIRMSRDPGTGETRVSLNAPPRFCGVFRGPDPGSTLNAANRVASGYMAAWTELPAQSIQPGEIVFYTVLGAVCGNGIREFGERCDDGNQVYGDGCSGDCTLEAECGNGIREPGETCDPSSSCVTSCPTLGCTILGLAGKADACTAQCVPAGTRTACVSGDACCPAGCTEADDSDCAAACGNSVFDLGEECDDGNRVSGDGCSATCTIEQFCGTDSECQDGDVCTADACVAGVCQRTNLLPADWFIDNDGDFYGTSWIAQGCLAPARAAPYGGDCDDDNPARYPGAPEICNGADDDCDGIIDDGIPTSPYWFDFDGDGRGGSFAGQFCADPGSGYVQLPGDCNDGSPDIYSGAPEICDGMDNDCDGLVDEGLATTPYWFDTDGDGFGGFFYGSLCADPGPGTSTIAGDCNDGDAGSFPGAAEVCDGLDNDCDGIVDEGLARTPYWFDTDGDGFGGFFYGNLCADPGAGTSLVPGDCNDGRPDTYPGAPEVCDGADNDCNGLVDDGVPFADFWFDADGDGCGGAYFGSACEQPAGTVASPGDCDDFDPAHCTTCPDPCGEPPWPDSDNDGTPDCLDCSPGDPSSYPGAPEVCDGADNDCNGFPDDGLTFTHYWVDGDGDGFGSGTAVAFCADPGAPWVLVFGDCSEGSPDSHPGAPELCDGADNDCDGIPDDGLTFTPYWVDADGDGFGSATTGSLFCADPGVPWVPVGGDCHDGNTAYYPTAPEICDNADNDCDGVPDDGLAFTPYWVDADGDGFGGGTATTFCENPGSPWTTVSGDCHDGSLDTWPGALELCDGLDNDCNGRIDDGGACG